MWLLRMWLPPSLGRAAWGLLLVVHQVQRFLGLEDRLDRDSYRWLVRVLFVDLSEG